MTNAQPTRGQLERALSQRIQALYVEELGQRPEKVTCQFFDEKLAIVLENLLTASERSLLASGQQDFVQQLRSQLDIAIKPRLKALVEEIISVDVTCIVGSTNLECNVSGIIVVLENAPPIRDQASIPKAKKRTD